MPLQEHTLTEEPPSAPLDDRPFLGPVEKWAVTHAAALSPPEDRCRGSLFGQVILVIAAWIYLCGLHWSNDGLWFSGDAAVNAANGLFWRDYLSGPSLDPKGFALAYYARYPAINLTTHPPAFHLLEAAMFTAFGASPYVAKGLVLGFALVASLYVTAWLRRWVAEEAGVAGALVPLLPGVVVWSHAVMLNVPALALALGTLYHSRRWLESPTRRNAILAGASGTAVVLTYYTAGVVMPIILAWAITMHRRRLTENPGRLAVGLVGSALLVTAILTFALRWAPTQVLLTLPLPEKLGSLDNWTYYLECSPRLIGLPLLALSASGLVAGALVRRWRRETLLLASWIGTLYLFFSLLRAREERYILLIIAPLVGLCAIAVVSATRWIGAIAGWRRGRVRAAAICALVALTLGQAGLAAQVRVPQVEGFREVVAFLEHVEPDGVYLYDGQHTGIFTVYVQFGDPGYRRRVVRGDKLLYATAIYSRWRRRQFVSSPQETIEALRERGGARWVAISIEDQAPSNDAARHLRAAVEGPEFELCRSFPIHAWGVRRVDVYRFLPPIRELEEVSLPFPILGDDDHYPTYRVRPIRTRSVR
jgi:hypothetical protein